MAFRKRLNKKKSNKNFKKGMNVNKRNIVQKPSRGGHRL